MDAMCDVSGISMEHLVFAFAERANELNYNFHSFTQFDSHGQLATEAKQIYFIQCSFTSSDGIINL